MSRRAILAAFGLTLASAVAPPLAGAGTVGVAVDGSLHEIVFEAGDGEANAVVVGVAGEIGDPTTYSVVDSNAGIVAASGCSGGGPAGVPVTCALPRSALPCVVRGCPAIAPVTNRIEINLGAGEDSLDSTGVPAGDGGSGTLSVVGNGGAGADRLTDGPNASRLDPGTGADVVSSGDGYDSVVASSGAPDEPDVYDLGEPSFDTIDYRAATYPLTVSLDDIANDGGVGEGDQILGAEGVLGGALGDRIIGSAVSPQELRGFGGDDVIEGGPGYDLMSGNGGDDTFRGQGGLDRIFGDGGDDRMAGGAGNDFLEGFGGRDRLRGNAGADQLIGATSVTRDDAVDRLDCGPSEDRRAYAGPEDRVRRCERVLRSSD